MRHQVWTAGNCSMGRRLIFLLQQGWLIVRSRIEDPWFWKAHGSERYVECATDITLCRRKERAVDDNEKGCRVWMGSGMVSERCHTMEWGISRVSCLGPNRAYLLLSPAHISLAALTLNRLVWLPLWQPLSLPCPHYTLTPSYAY
ncbi:hypothetical protein M9H77_27045 [Catharanthus roseus]|uniref:Uncharacterized protein n=1 Tax=Catharanthus roseus TaxID=4058 RepID=A0ACC0ACU4_CATRO|nr:hypothetical protein M9H77_27045 [Catharanthus roseus]